MTVDARRRALALAIGVLLPSLEACGRLPAPPTLTLEQAQGRPGAVLAQGLSPRTLQALKRLAPDSAAWPSILRVATGQDGPAVAGRYVLRDRTLRFEPAFPLEAGRTYQARLDLRRLDDPAQAPVEARLTPVAPSGPPPQVLAVYPSGPTAPQNLLRLYLQFSAPMSQGRPGALTLRDSHGRDLQDPFLPLGYELWSPDHTRLTVLIDPGRVKRGILRDAVLRAGEGYTLAVGSDWRDAQGRAVTGGFTHSFMTILPERRALDLSAWRAEAPQAGTRRPLILTFDRPLDRALLASALGVSTRAGERVDGRLDIAPGETGLRFTPAGPWGAGPYQVTAQPWLEDPAGNRPGRPFERDPRAAPAKAAPLSLPFLPVAAASAPGP